MTIRTPRRSLAIAAGLAADRVFGEPPAAIHPVARFGQGMTRLERSLYRDSRAVGVVYCAAGVAAGGIVGWLLQRGLGRQRALALATSAAVAGRMLGREANAIGSLLVYGDLDGARRQLPSLVGRSPDGLSEVEISRAVVESVAENSIDAVIAPVFWGLVAGAPGVLVHRAINTMDAMVGHRSQRYERFGWASARLDDVANWIPARIGAVAVAAVRPRRATTIARTVCRDAALHPSPNGGVIEAAFAAALDVRLGGANRYGDTVEQRGVLGDGRVVAPRDVARAVVLLGRITVLVGSAAVVVEAVGRRRRTGRRR